MSFKLTILGCSSASPTSERNPSAQLLNTGKGGTILLDCAEATQIQIRRFRLRLLNIERILITHLHGDHIFGLPGLLATWHLLGRKKEVHIYAVEDLKTFLDDTFRISNTVLTYPLIFHVIDPSLHSCVYEDKHIEIHTLPLIHRIPTCGYLIREKPKELNIIKSRIDEFSLNYEQIKNLKAGKSIQLDNYKYLSPEEVTTKPSAPVSYAYCTDTSYSEELIPLISGVNMLFHEATFNDSDKLLATEKQHSTSRQAAMIAKNAGAKNLLIGHFSGRYKQLHELLAQAREVFPNTTLAVDGQVINII